MFLIRKLEISHNFLLPTHLILHHLPNLTIFLQNLPLNLSYSLILNFYLCFQAFAGVFRLQQLLVEFEARQAASDVMGRVAEKKAEFGKKRAASLPPMLAITSGGKKKKGSEETPMKTAAAVARRPQGSTGKSSSAGAQSNFRPQRR